MEALRHNSETIVTILEVLLYDPLYAWTITPAQAFNRQFNPEDDNGSNPQIQLSDDKGRFACRSNYAPLVITPIKKTGEVNVKEFTDRCSRIFEYEIDVNTKVVDVINKARIMGHF